MRVLSKLAQIDFKFGRITRHGNLLVVESREDSAMKSTVYISPGDVAAVLKQMLVSLGAIVFIIGLPYFLYRWNRSDKTIHHGVKQTKKPWPTV
jgi:hypothetical protein